MLYKVASPETASILFPLTLRAALRLEEPLMWRGSCIVELYKGKGDSTSTDSFRDVWIESYGAKDLHAFVRSAFFPHVEGFARDTQCGGLRSLGADVAQHLARAVWDYASVIGKPIALLFVDLTRAFASLVRELAYTQG
eukprot:14641252-Alexandrium_andersonii.AAC.1